MQIKEYINRQFKNEFLRNTATLITGTGLSVAIPVLVSPILTRLYSPKEFGIFALYYSTINFLTTIVTAKYELTIILPTEESDSVILIALSIIVSFVLSILLLVGILIFDLSTSLLTNIRWVYTIPLTFFSLGIFQSSYYWMNRKKRFKNLATAKITQTGTIAFMSILFGFVVKNHWGMICGYIIGQLGASIFLFSKLFADIKPHFQSINRKNLLTLAKRYKHFPLFLTGGALTENFAAQLPVFMLTSFFGHAIVGFFSLAQRVARVPTTIIAAAIGDVFRQKANQEYIQKRECRSIFRKTFIHLLLLAIIPFTIFFAIAPLLFGIVFGSNWVIAGQYARILVPMLFLQFITNPLSNMFIIAEKQKIQFMMQVYLLVSNTLALFLGFYFFRSVQMALIFFALTYSSKYIFELTMSYQFSQGLKEAYNKT